MNMMATVKRVEWDAAVERFVAGLSIEPAKMVREAQDQISPRARERNGYRAEPGTVTEWTVTVKDGETDLTDDLNQFGLLPRFIRTRKALDLDGLRARLAADFREWIWSAWDDDSSTWGATLTALTVRLER